VPLDTRTPNMQHGTLYTQCETGTHFQPIGKHSPLYSLLSVAAEAQEPFGVPLEKYSSKVTAVVFCLQTRARQRHL